MSNTSFINSRLNCLLRLKRGEKWIHIFKDWINYSFLISHKYSLFPTMEIFDETDMEPPKYSTGTQCHLCEDGTLLPSKRELDSTSNHSLPSTTPQPPPPPSTFKLRATNVKENERTKKCLHINYVPGTGPYPLF